MQLISRRTRELESLYRQHGPALVLFAAAITGERERAQDAVQQVFLKLLQENRLEQAEDKKAYLFACVRNAVLNEARSRGRNTSLDADAMFFEPPQRDYAAELNLRRALHELSQEQREVIVLHVWGEMTFAQISELLEISSNTAASRYRYALTKLRAAMCAKEDSCANP
ncbi:MAG TPA: sigma-70 family RNA polymerase sigma factor [Terriglobales bacterium]|nr:sigma-70 family RNA polymerase sigma factor [Terriglobales bacterium]